MNKLILKPGKEKPLLRRHPWIFSGALTKVPKMQPGELAQFCKSDGTPLAIGYVNPLSQLCGRVLTFDPTERIDENFWQRRLEKAISRREALLGASLGQTTGCRLVMSESDELPGLIVDLYGNWLVVQVLTAGMDNLLDSLIEPLWSLTEGMLERLYQNALESKKVSQENLPPRKLAGLYEKSEDSIRALEGLGEKTGIRKSARPLNHGDQLTDGVGDRTSFHLKSLHADFLENGLRLTTDLYGGQKTGYYHDQRENRAAVAALAKGRRVLDCCSYTGGFTLSALKAGAKEVLSIDQNQSALETIAKHLELNRPYWQQDPSTTTLKPWEKFKPIHGDAFKILRELYFQDERFDLVVLDPPKFAAKESHIPQASRGYKDLNLWGFKLLQSGGLLATFSCSGHISPDLFQKIVFGAALDAGKNVQILKWFNQAEDHPVLMSFPEAHYLKGLLVRVM